MRLPRVAPSGRFAQLNVHSEMQILHLRSRLTADLHIRGDGQGVAPLVHKDLNGKE